MPANFPNGLDLNLTSLLNAIIHPLATDPASPINGQVWTLTSGILKIRLNGATISLGRLDQISAPTAAVNLNAQRITALADGTAGTDATTLQQVQTLVNAVTSNMDWKDGGARVASTANVVLTGPGATMDGVTLAVGDRVLLKDQTAGAENGLYVFNGSTTAMTRTTDADTAAEVLGMVVAVQEGSVNSDSGWLLTTNAPITLGTTALAFTRIFGGAAASGPRKFALTYGGNAVQTITHNLATTEFTWAVRDATTNNSVFPDVIPVDANTAQATEAAAPGTNSRKIVIVG